MNIRLEDISQGRHRIFAASMYSNKSLMSMEYCRVFLLLFLRFNIVMPKWHIYFKINMTKWQ